MSNTITIPIGKLKKINLWKVLSIILILILFFILLNNSSKNSLELKKELIEQKFIDFANKNSAEIQIIETVDFGNLYQITISSNGEEAPLYVTKDGNYFTTELIPLN